MAYEAINQEDEQKVQQGFGTQGTQNTNLTTQAENVPTLGGQQSNLVQGQAAQQTQQVTGGQMSGGQKSSGMGARLSNLKKYIEANRGVSTAEKIKTNLEGQRDLLKGNISSAYSGFQQNQGLIDEKSRLSKGEQLIKASNEGGRGLFEQGKTEAFTGTSTPQQQQVDFSEYGQTVQDRLAEFNKYKAGERQQFDISNLTDLERQKQELAQKAQNTQSESGRYQLLREMFKKPSYTTGQQRLDQLLLQAQPEETGKLQNISQNLIETIDPEMDKLIDLRDAENKLIREKASDISKNIETGLSGTSGARNSFESDIQNRLKLAQEDAAQKYSKLKTAFESGTKLTKQELKDYTGITDETELENLTNTYNQTRARTVVDKILSGMTLNESDVLPIYEANNLAQAHMPIAKYRTYPWASAQDLANQLNATDTRGLINFLSSTYKGANEPGIIQDDVANKYKEFMTKSSKLNPEDYLSQRTLGISDISTAEDYARQQALDLLQNKYSNLVGEPIERTPFNTIQTDKLAQLRDNYTEADMQNAINNLDDSYISPTELKFRNWLRTYMANR